MKWENKGCVSGASLGTAELLMPFGQSLLMLFQQT